jgi:hypothetical protein
VEFAKSFLGALAFRSGASFYSRLIAGCLLFSPLCHAQATSPAKIPGSPPNRILKFYEAPKPLPPGKPGELIHSSPAEDYFLSADFSAYRILYHSRSATDQDVAVSAVVLLPEKTPPKEGWPVIAWAHGFTGAARQCAPSLLRNLYYGPFFSMYINLGYAVVATDYAGLGTDSRNAVMDGLSNANDVINSIPAAGAAVPQLGKRWVVMGPYMGANAAIGVAEMEGRLRDPNYFGAVAISGIADLPDLYDRLSKEQALGMLSVLAYGIKTIYPEFKVGDMLKEKALPAYHDVGETCGILGKIIDLPVADLLKSSWDSNRSVIQFFDRNTLGRTPAYGPLLIIEDEGDPSFPPSLAVPVVARLCKQGDRVQVNKFSDPGPGQVLGGSVRDQMSWIEGRFAGRTAQNSCP